MNRAAQLLTLQKIDLEIQDKMKLLRQIQEALRNDAGLNELRQEHEKVREELEYLESMQLELDLELRGISEHLEEQEALLYSGQIRNPKELAHLQREIESLKRRRDQLDEKLLASMERTERMRRQFKDLEKRLKELEATWEEQKARWEEAERKVKRYLVYLRRQREELRRVLPPGDLALYDELVRSKGGVAVAELKEGVCGVCGVSVSQGKIEAVRRGTDLVTCSNCERILAIVT